MRLEGRRILITGAARGIGLAVARACADEGAGVLATDVDGAALEDAASDNGPAVQWAVLDVTDRAAVRTVLDDFVADGPLDGLVNNAAMLDNHDAATVTDAQLTRVMEVNLAGALRVTQEALGALRRSKGASVVNTVSSQAFQAVPAASAYGISKGALMMLTRSMAVDFGADGIRVNAVAPGFIDTRMARLPDGRHEHEAEEFRQIYIDGGRIPLRRAGTPEDCAGAFVFLLSDDSRYVSGQAIAVDGGLTATY